MHANCNNEAIVQELTYSAMCRAGAIGVTGVDMASPHFASFRNKNWSSLDWTVQHCRGQRCGRTRCDSY